MFRSNSQDGLYSDEEKQLTKEEIQIQKIQRYQNSLHDVFDHRPLIDARDDFFESKDSKENATKMLRIFTNELVHDNFSADDPWLYDYCDDPSEFEYRYQLRNYTVTISSAYVLWAPAILSYLALSPQRNAETAIQASVPYKFSLSLIKIVTGYLENEPDLFNLNLLTSVTNETYEAQCRPIAERVRKKTSTLDDCVYIQNVCIRIAGFLDPLSPIKILHNLQYGLVRRGEDFRNKELIKKILINVQSLFTLAERLLATHIDDDISFKNDAIRIIKLYLMGAIIELDELDMRSVDFTLPMSVYFTPILTVSAGCGLGGLVSAMGNLFWKGSGWPNEGFYGIWNCKQNLAHEILYLNLICEKSKYQQQKQLGMNILHPEEFVSEYCKTQALNSKHPYALRDGFRRVSELDRQSPAFLDKARAIFLEMNLVLMRIEKNKEIKPASNYFGCKNRSGHVFFGCGLFEYQGRLEHTVRYLTEEQELQYERTSKVREFHSQAKKKIGNLYFGCKNPSGAKPEAKAEDFLVQREKPYIPYVRRRASFS